MISQHLSEEKLQMVASGQQVADAATTQHIESCAFCQEQLEVYKLIMSTINEQPKAAFSFDVAEAVLQQLPAAPAKKYYIGLACSYHDSAIAILDSQGKILFAEATERSLQIKRATGMVCDEVVNIENLIREYCSDAGEIILSYSWSKSYINKLIFQLSFGFFRVKRMFLDLLLKNIASDVLTSYDIVGMEYRQLSSMIQTGISLISSLRSQLPGCKIRKLYYSHHLTHAANACYTSPFATGTCVVMDGFGEKGASSIYKYSSNQITPIFIQRNLASMGFFYALVTRLCGFDPARGEAWKVMGLASYGKVNPVAYQLLKSMIKIKGHAFRYTLYRRWLKSLKILSKEVKRDDLSFQELANLAHSGQLVFSETMQTLLNNICKLYSSKNLIYSGGCALNSVFNGMILNNTNYQQLYIPSAPSDDGNALGAALLSFYRENPKKESCHKCYSPYLGSKISTATLQKFLKFSAVKSIKKLPGNICKVAATLIAAGKLVGWVQGRAEFGPRALGNRSILADPRSILVKEKINSSIKFREEFRPFAPSILHEYGGDYFENYQESPFMERTLVYKKQVLDKVPAVTHVDNTGRLQSVKKESNSTFYDLIYAFYKITGIPLVLNTSFNIMGKPIIHSLEDAIAVFFTGGLDALVIDNYLIEKESGCITKIKENAF